MTLRLKEILAEDKLRKQARLLKWDIWEKSFIVKEGMEASARVGHQI